MSETEVKTVLSQKLIGGPHGIGDPDDKTLRVSEKKILIPKLIRERSKKVKCIEAVAEFEKCAKSSGIFMPFQCRAENNKMKDCLAQWYYNDEFVNECTQIYLDERSEYRRTGISKKQKLLMAQAEAEAKK